MEHVGILGAHLPQHAHVEPISFGIDQILSHAEHSCMLDYGHAAYGGGYTGTGGSYGMAYHTNVNGTNVNGNGVIRVPAHRPLGGGNSCVPPVSGNNLSALTFPWMESNRRYTKDRFTGREQETKSLLLIN